MTWKVSSKPNLIRLSIIFNRDSNVFTYLWDKSIESKCIAENYLEDLITKTVFHQIAETNTKAVLVKICKKISEMKKIKLLGDTDSNRRTALDLANASNPDKGVADFLRSMMIQYNIYESELNQDFEIEKCLNDLIELFSIHDNFNTDRKIICSKYIIKLCDQNDNVIEDFIEQLAGHISIPQIKSLFMVEDIEKNNYIPLEIVIANKKLSACEKMLFFFKNLIFQKPNTKK